MGIQDTLSEMMQESANERSRADASGEQPAFPVVSDSFGHYSGMTLRDYFAIQALNALLSMPDIIGHEGYTRASLAEECFKVADAMLTARNYSTPKSPTTPQGDA